MSRVRAQILRLVGDEIASAHANHRDNSMLTSPTRNPLAVLVEEVGEVARALNDDEPLDALVGELVQVAAMACTWIERILPVFGFVGGGPTITLVCETCGRPAGKWTHEEEIPFEAVDRAAREHCVEHHGIDVHKMFGVPEFEPAEARISPVAAAEASPAH